MSAAGLSATVPSLPARPYGSVQLQHGKGMEFMLSSVEVGYAKLDQAADYIRDEMVLWCWCKVSRPGRPDGRWDVLRGDES